MISVCLGGVSNGHAKTIWCVCVTSEQYRIDVKPLLFSFFFLLAGGSSTIASLLPTKTLAIGGDTRPDQSGVSALFVLPTWHGAKPRTQQQKFWFYTVVAIWDFLWRRFQPYLHSIFTVMAKGSAKNPTAIIFYFRDFVFGWFVVFGIPSTYSQFSSKRSTLGHCF